MIKLFIILPFIFSVFLATLIFAKNPIISRRIAKIFSAIQLLFSISILFKEKPIEFSFFNLNFMLDNFSSCLIFLVSFVVLLYLIMSKTQIKKFNRIFYVATFLFMGIVNLIILADNIFIILFLIFWLLLLNYFLNVFFAKKEDKKYFDIQLANDLFWFFIGIFLIISNFGKYFIVNDEAFNFTNLVHNLYNITENYTFIAFVGFLILIGKLFNLIPFNAKNTTLSTKANPLIFTLNNLFFIAIGCNLFLKCYLNFDYILYQIQAELAIYLLFNFVIFAVATLLQNRLFKFLTNLFAANLIIGLVSIFSFEKESFNVFSYFTLAFCVSYAMCAFIFMIISKKMKTDNLNKFYKIEDKTRLSQIFITFSLLNIASIPLFSMFSSELICLMMIFSTDFDKNILNFSSYFIIIGSFVMTLSVFGVLYKILIKPNINSKIQFSLCNHQILVFVILAFLILLMGICPECVLNQIDTIVEIEKF